MIISLSGVATNKPVKPVKIPKSIAFAAEKTKSRVVKAVPGRYILKNRKGLFVIVRFKEETRYTGGVGTKLFSTSTTANDVEDYFVVESETNQPGARNNAAGQKLGKKTHAKGMMAAGWWMFVKGADGKVKKAYIGGRISGRRLLSLLDPSTVKTAEPKKSKTNNPLANKINDAIDAKPKAEPKQKAVTENNPLANKIKDAKPKAEPKSKAPKEALTGDSLIAKLPLMKKNYAEFLVDSHMKDVKYLSSAKAKKDLEGMKEELNHMRQRSRELQGQNPYLDDKADILDMQIRDMVRKMDKFSEEAKEHKKDPEAYENKIKTNSADWAKRGNDPVGMIKANEGKVPESKIKAIRMEMKTRRKIGSKPDVTKPSHFTRQEMERKQRAKR